MSYENASELSRESTGALRWPADVDLDVWYQAERAEVDDVIKDALDLSVWSLEARKDTTSIYLHCKNNEKLSYSVRVVARVAGTVTSVMDCLRSADSASLRAFMKLFHPKAYLDSEVLHNHVANNNESESLTLKWLALASGKTALGRSKEFCVREYCTVIPNHRAYGTVGVCKFESYDGVGARYAIRAKPDTYSLTVYEPSSFVIYQTGEEGMLNVTLTFSMRKARGSDSVSPGVKSLAMRMAMDMVYLQRAVQHLLFQPSTLVKKKEWVSDNERSNCSLCVQSFGMLKRRHHCRVCGEVVCASCTVFKVVSNNDQEPSRIRVCKACLGKSTAPESAQANVTVPPPPAPNTGTFNSNRSVNQLQHQSSTAASYSHGTTPPFKNITLSQVSTSSSTASDDSRRSGDEGDSIASMPQGMLPPYKSQSASPPLSSLYSKSTSSSYSDYDTNPAASVHGSVQGSPRSSNQSTATVGSSSLQRSGSKTDKRTNYFNEDFAEICMLAMETLNCAMAGIRTDDLELVNYIDGQQYPDLPRSLPTFRRIAARGKPCIVLDVSADKRIAGDKRNTAKLQFFVGIPLIMDGEVIGDLCVADRFPRESIDYKAVEVLIVLGKTVTQYMTSRDFMEDLAYFKALQRKKREQEEGIVSNAAMKEVAF
ncbi:hypothetical protein Poli38472_012889 [Pythium oligandrum]|uniref:FYVE-type domain-containing protein n=1 Tax=Pythium oligandrum TaxID=41045 RepID=A0A8K1CIW6_PYTOL|nr:hypothetical protein Poli38472_012889 [Pythium oligandrum]|eukprot:TMW64267.1 hypothetical protein Poli38472_012889 [Pythium oligandrum]